MVLRLGLALSNPMTSVRPNDAHFHKSSDGEGSGPGVFVLGKFEYLPESPGFDSLSFRVHLRAQLSAAEFVNWDRMGENTKQRAQIRVRIRKLL